MINLDEYIRFRQLEKCMRGFCPKRREYLGVRILCHDDRVCVGTKAADVKYEYYFHPMFGTIVLYGGGNVGKTQFCEQIDEEIRKEQRANTVACGR